MRGNPEQLTQIFEAGNSICVVGQDSIIGRKSQRCNFKDTTPIFGNWLIPHQVASAGANAGTQVGGRGFDKEALPIRNVFLKPISGLSGKIIEVLKVSGDDDALGSIKFQIGK